MVIPPSPRPTPLFSPHSIVAAVVTTPCARHGLDGLPRRRQRAGGRWAGGRRHLRQRPPVHPPAGGRRARRPPPHDEGQGRRG
ncbi:hypothetical protein BU14_0056s0058 [Porphyra umbilicalis]|uniref:Uncharacterized protein n=1 Tax=Porphyra umbilicalis TaxID=2786 RepID=A0A1X6PHR3_PORUM|nr:hypothetical protein BU14_0056s0058 [Porphyra umbilicalis]|eukprot:OSX80276.1 hypothetical protein BU14_0056s0058 [Porphyra umbilicalis]